jgi:hypothetical protein
MKMLWCWRCRMKVPMLDEEEFAMAQRLYGAAFDSEKNHGKNLKERFQPLLEYYFDITGWQETEHNAIMHHRIAQYGPICEQCGKPYRTPLANFCAACGNK